MKGWIALALQKAELLQYHELFLSANTKQAKKAKLWAHDPCGRGCAFVGSSPSCADAAPLSSAVPPQQKWFQVLTCSACACPSDSMESHRISQASMGFACDSMGGALDSAGSHRIPSDSVGEGMPNVSGGIPGLLLLSILGAQLADEVQVSRLTNARQICCGFSDSVDSHLPIVGNSWGFIHPPIERIELVGRS